MPNNYSPRSRRTMFFIGVTTGKSSIMRVFPRWAEHLKLNASIEGFDFIQHDKPEHYREAVDFIKNDPLTLGALVTTHKIDLLTACRDRFEKLDRYAEILGEISSISKREGKLVGHAKDPISSGLSLEAFVKPDHWKKTGGEMLLLGAGGSSQALSIYLKEKADRGGDVPSKIIITNRSQPRLDDIRRIHKECGLSIPVEYHLCPKAEDNDKVVARLKPGSLVANGTGLGKDAPGSPLTDKVVFPENGLVWEFNYRGDLIFLDQAKAQEKSKSLTIEDGWIYFIHGWTRVVAEVFNVEIPTSGPNFDILSTMAKEAR